jgi:hypothetical protein
MSGFLFCPGLGAGYGFHVVILVLSGVGSNLVQLNADAL